MTSSLTAPNDGFYSPVAYKGAFNSVNWASDWGFAAESGLITGAAAGTPVETPLPFAPTLIITPNGANVDIKCPSQAGYTYTLESTAGLNPTSWNPATGVTPSNAQAGTGGTLTFTVSATGAKYFRVSAN